MGLRSGVWAILFTDMVGSTEQRARLGDVAGDALRREHDAIVNRVLAVHRGEWVEGTGDGAMCAFASAADALAAGVSIQQAIDRRNDRSDEALRLRVGVSLGDLVHEDAGLMGLAAHEAARVCALCDAGEILASDLVRAVAGPRTEREFVARGEFELKGLPAPVTVWEVPWEPASEAQEAMVALPPRLADPGTPFVGREREREVLDDALDAVRTDAQCRTVLVSGEPGIGKTTLTAGLGRDAHATGAVVLYGRCQEDFGIPYQAWTEALTHVVRGAPEQLLQAHVAARGSALSRLVPDLVRRVGGSEIASVDPQAERYLLFGAVVDLLERASSYDPVVLVLDDLHWADLPSLDLLRYVVGADSALRLLVLATYRDSDIADDDPRAAMLAALHRERSVERLSLGGLDVESLGALLETVAGHDLGPEGLALRAALAAETDGNPFFVTEVLRDLTETGAIRRGDDGRWTATGSSPALNLPTSVREVITQRVIRLGDDARQVLTLAAVIGREFELDILADVSELDEAAILDVLDTATAAALVRPTSEHAEGYTFVHALVEHALADAQSPARRRRTHARIAEALESRCGDDPGDRVAELAQHWLEAGSAPDKAIEYASRAGADALARLAPEDALTWYERALDLLDGGAAHDDPRRGGVIYGIGVAQRDVGNAAFRETLLSAARLAAKMEDSDLLARAALANTRGFFSVAGRVDDDRVAVLQDAVAGTQGPATKARLLAQLALELTFNGDFPARRALAEEAIALARSSGNSAVLVAVLNNVYFPLWVPETHRWRLELTAEAIELAEMLDDPVLAYWANVRRSFAVFQDCDLAGYERHEDRVCELAQRIGQPALQWFAQIMHVTRLLLGGQLADAERAIRAHLELGSSLGQPDALVFYGAHLGSLRRMQGRSDEFLIAAGPGIVRDEGTVTEEAVIDAVARATPTAMLAATAVTYCEIGRDGEARRLAEELAASDFAAVPLDHNWLHSMLNLAQVVAHCELTKLASPLSARLQPFAGMFAVVGGGIWGVVDLSLGVLARTAGSLDDALEHLERAAELHAQLDAPYFVALTDLERARTLLDRDAPGDAQRAQVLLASARRAADADGFAGIERRTAELAARGALST